MFLLVLVPPSQPSSHLCSFHHGIVLFNPQRWAPNINKQEYNEGRLLSVLSLRLDSNSFTHFSFSLALSIGFAFVLHSRARAPSRCKAMRKICPVCGRYPPAVRHDTETRGQHRILYFVVCAESAAVGSLRFSSTRGPALPRGVRLAPLCPLCFRFKNKK